MAKNLDDRLKKIQNNSVENDLAERFAKLRSETTAATNVNKTVATAVQTKKTSPVVKPSQQQKASANVRQNTVNVNLADNGNRGVQAQLDDLKARSKQLQTELSAAKTAEKAATAEHRAPSSYTPTTPTTRRAQDVSRELGMVRNQIRTVRPVAAQQTAAKEPSYDNYDLSAAKKNLQGLKSKAADADRRIRSGSGGLRDGLGGASVVGQMREQKADLERQIQAQEMEIRKAEYYKKSKDYAQLSVKSNFSNVSRKGSLKKGNNVMWVRNHADQYKQLTESGHGANGKDGKYLYMTEDEVKTYNYLFATDEKKAKEYLDFIEDALNYRMGTEMGEKVRGIDNDFGRFAATTLYGVYAGLDQFMSGATQFLSSDQRPTSAAQYGSAYVREDLADYGGALPGWMGGASLGQAAYDTVTTTANMAPSILLSSLTGGITGSAALAQGVGAVTLGASAAGNAYGQALAEGYDKKSARIYSTMVGISEAYLQNVLGGITALGGLPEKTARWVANWDNALLRASANVGLNMLGEGAEEYLQDILEPALRNAILLENNSIDLVTPEAIYSGLLGALTAGFLEGPSTVSTDIQRNRYGAQLRGNHMDKNLIEVSLRDMDQSTQAYQTAKDIKSGKLKDSTHNLGTLFEQYVQEGGDMTVFDAAPDGRGGIAFNTGSGGEAYQRAKGLAQSRESGYTERVPERLDDITTDYVHVDQGGGNHMSLAKAQEKADILSSYAAGEQVSAKDINKLGLTQTSLREVFERYTGVTLPEDFNKQSDSAKIQTVMRLQPKPEVSAAQVAEQSRVGGFAKIRPYIPTSAVEGYDMTPVLAPDGVAAPGMPGAVIAPRSVVESVKDGSLGPGFERVEDQTDTKWAPDLNAVSIKFAGKDMTLSDFSDFVKTLPDGDKMTTDEVRQEFIDNALAQGVIGQSDYDFYKEGMSNGRTDLHPDGLQGVPGQRTGEQGEGVPRAAGEAEGRSAAEPGTVASRRGVNAQDRAEDRRGAGKAEQSRVIEQLDELKLETETVSPGKDRADMQIIAEKDYDRVAKIVPGFRKLIETAQSNGATVQVMRGNMDTGMKTESGEAVTANGVSLPKQKLIRVRVDDPSWRVTQLGYHELFHYRFDKSVKFKTAAQALVTGMSIDEALVSHIRDRYDSEKGPYTAVLGQYGDASEAAYWNEFCADLAGDLNRFDLAEDKFQRLRTRLAKVLGDDVLAPSEPSIRSEAERSQEIRDEGLRAETVEGTSVIHNVEELEDKTYRKEGEIVNKKGDPVVESNGTGSSRFSLTTYDESGRKVLRDWLDKAVKKKDLTREDADALYDEMERIYELAKQAKDSDQYEPFSEWSEAKVVVDSKGNPVFSVVKNNGEYVMNLDFSLVCKKRATLDAVFNELVKRGVAGNLILGEEQIVRVNDLIRSYGFETACALCFVDAKRYRQANVADTFVTLYNDVLRMIKPKNGKAVYNYHNFGNNAQVTPGEGGIDTLADADLDFTELDRFIAENKPENKKSRGSVDYQTAKYLRSHPEGRKLLLRGDFLSTAGFDAVAEQNEDIMKLYNSKKGTGGPKSAESNVQYLNEILKSRSFSRAKAYSVGGVRIQSFSDYIPRMVFDYAQMIADLSAKKLPAHSYTKESLYVMQFGLTGIKINMSLVPDVVEDGVAPGLDKDGHYVWKDGQSFGSLVGVKGSAEEGYQLALKIQADPQYGKNCGTIAVGISSEHIRAMMKDPAIRMIIPYHKSSISHLVAGMNNIAAFTDYTDVQNTRILDKETGKLRKLDPNKSGDKKLLKELEKVDFNKLMHEGVDPREAAERYVRKCEELGLTPKFDEFAYKTFDGVAAEENGQKAVDENYYKLLTDFAVYDESGAFTPQGDVTMTFPSEGSAFGSFDELMKQGLSEDAILEGKRDKDVPDIVNDIIAGLGPKTEDGSAREEGVQYSIATELENNEQLTDADRELLTVTQSVLDKVSAGKGWTGREVNEFYRNNPEYDFVARFFDGDKGTKKSMQAFVARIHDIQTLDALSWYSTQNHWDPAGRYRGSITKARNVYKARVDELARDLGGQPIKLEHRAYTVKEARDIFDQYNTNEALTKLADKVFPLAERFRVQVYASSKVYDKAFGKNAGMNSGPYVWLNRGYFGDSLHTGQNKASTILHEMIHSVTVYALDPDYRNDDIYSDPNVQEAVNRLEEVYNEVKADPAFAGDYGITNIKEFAAELANVKFREKLAKKNLLQRVIDAIRKFFGIETETALDGASAALDYLLDNVDEDGLLTYHRETRRLTERWEAQTGKTRYSVASEDSEIRPNTEFANKTIGAQREREELSDIDARYSIREEDPPKKTGVAYKVFYAKDGQLYPPMVANPNGEGTPVGVWLNADVGVAAPPSKTGRAQVRAGGKGTQGGSGSLAFRPGWHLGDVPLAKQFARLNPETGVKELFPADFVWAECEYAMDEDYQDEAMSYGYTDNGKFRHSYAGLPRIPENGYYRYRTNPNPDTVPWVITGAMKVTKILTDDDVARICREHGVEPMQRQGGPIDLAKFGLTAGEQNGDTRYSISPELRKQLDELRDDGVGAANAGEVNTDYDRLQAQSKNFHDSGPAPARHTDVPKQDFEGRNIPKSASTVYGANGTTDSAAKQLEGMIASGELSFDTETDTRAVGLARRTLNGKGFDGALEQYRNNVNNGTASKDNVALGQQLLLQAMREGNDEATAELLTLYTRNSTTVAQALQAQSMFRKLSPEGQLIGLRKAIEAINEKYGTNVELTEDEVGEYTRAGSQEEREKVHEKIVKRIAETLPRNFKAKFDAIRYLAMLGNPRTHIRNILGNALFQAPVIVKNRVGAVGELLANAVSGGKVERTKSLTGIKSQTLIKEAQEDFKKVKDHLGQINKYNENKTVMSEIEQSAPAFSNGNVVGKTLNTLAEGNSNLLELEDMAFKRYIYVQSLAGYLQANGIQSIAEAEKSINGRKVLVRAREYAAQEAMRNTFNDRNQASDAVSSLGKLYRSENKVARAAGYVVEGVVPFKRTPTNILVRALEYSPAGVLNGIYVLTKGVKGKNSTEITRGIDRLAAGVSGSALFALGMMLAAAGRIKGGEDDDEKQKNFDSLRRRQNYSLELDNGKSVTLDWLAPEAIPFFMGVEMYNAALEGGLSWEDLSKVAKNTTSPMLEMSMLQGLNDAFDNAAYAKNQGNSVLGSVLASALTSYVTQVFPTVLGQAERTAEDQRMTTYTDKNSSVPTDLQYTLGKVSQKVPHWDYNQIPFIDAWGRTTDTGSAPERAFNNMANPAYVSQVSRDPVEDELQRLYDATGESVLPERAAKKVKINKVEKNLTAEEYVTYATQLGQDRYNYVSAFIQSGSYNKLDDAARAKAIKEMYEYADKKAKSELFGQEPESDYSKITAALTEHNISPDVYTAAYARTSGLTSIKDKDGKSVNLSKSLRIMKEVYQIPGLSKDQIQYLAEALGAGKTVLGYSEKMVDNKLQAMENKYGKYNP